ncbi:capsular polysaccharide export protein, LipB/KpsS family [Sphingomonas sp. LT1P40]|uniref:capsular polysaccharide export protein, LipB/KpsS family n=1 Tax=Alteristakelama amylovorans TaxID=3096166 RepID=UPI002FC5ABCC
MTKPKILFFARGYQADLYPRLRDDRYDAVYVTLTRAEKAKVEAQGATVAACFEADFDSLPVDPVPDDYLITSYMSDRFLGRFGHAERVRILGREIAFWRQLLDAHRPIAVLNELVALEISEVLLIEARRRDIRYLAPMPAPTEGRFYWLPNPISLSGRHLPKLTPSAEMRALADTYVTQLKVKDWRPFYVRDLSGRRALKPFLVGLAKAAIWQLRALTARNDGPFRYESYDEEYSKRVAVYLKGLWTKYDRIEDIPAEVEVFFYPLHQEPEATLLYLSEFYANQPALIENIMRSLGPNQALVVKEHPVDKGSLLRRKFLELRDRYSSLYFVPAEVHGRQVLERSERVVTLTSTVGWEAAAIGKKVYVLGDIFFDSLPGVTRLSNINDLRRVLRDGTGADSRLEHDVLVDFIGSMLELSHRGNPFPHANWLEEPNTGLVRDAVAAGAGL